MTDNNDGTYGYEFIVEELVEVTFSVLITAETGGALAVDWYDGINYDTFVGEGREVPNIDNRGGKVIGLTGSSYNVSGKFSGKICALTSEEFTLSLRADDTAVFTIDGTTFPQIGYKNGRVDKQVTFAEGILTPLAVDFRAIGGLN